MFFDALRCRLCVLSQQLHPRKLARGNCHLLLPCDISLACSGLRSCAIQSLAAQVSRLHGNVMTAVFGDLISQLQDCNAELCAHFFNFTGAIQRDATPASVSEEPLEAPQPPAAGPDTIAQVPELAAQVHMPDFPHAAAGDTP